MNSMTRYCTGVFLLAFAISGTAWAQIKSISGTFADGQQVTISGSGFGTKPNGAKPYAVFDFSKNQAAASTYSRNPWGPPASGVLTTSAPAPNSQTSWRFRIGTDINEVYSGEGIGGTRFKNPSPAGRDLYVFYRIYYNWDGLDAYAAMSNWNLKGFRMWAGGTTAPDIYMPGYPGSDSSSGDPLTYAEGTDSGPLWLSPKDVHGIIKNTWKTEELYLRQSSAVGVSDGSWWMVSNGQKSGVLSNLLTRSSAYPNMYTDLFWHQVERSGFTAADGKYIAYDFVYIDDSLAHVVMTGSPTWNDTQETADEVQIPVSWSDGQIQVVVRRGAFSSLTGKYLYVFNPNGTLVSTTGFPVSGSGSTTPATPNPPTSVTVQ